VRATVFTLAILHSAAVLAVNARCGDVITIAGSELAPFHGTAIDRLALFACADNTCRPIPFQIDERDAVGRWVLDRGPEPNLDDPPGVLDANDALLFMAADAGKRANPIDLPGGTPAAEITVHDPFASTTRWVYLVTFADVAPRAEASYVHYDPATDRVRGRHVTLGFVDGMPGYLAVDDGPNLLDRLKVRASATFLFGLIHLSRSEADLRTSFMGWHAGPIRVVRGQRQWIRLGWGIHSPTFGSYTYFYPDAAQLPVSLRLNFPPTYFFGNIIVRAVLDFRDLRGWELIVPGMPDPIPIDGVMTPLKAALQQLPETWFALRGPEITLVQTLSVSPSLAATRRRLFYREDMTVEIPESIAGELPGIGYQLDRWEHVGSGVHELASDSYAVPSDLDVEAFMQARAVPLQVTIRGIRR